MKKVFVQNDKTLFIPDDVIDNIEQDKFGHQHLAEVIVDSIVKTKPPFTIGVFGGWGTGKSSLIHIVEKNITEQGIKTASIDAWRYSSTENLKRAFLINVANQLDKTSVRGLTNDIFSSSEEIIGMNESFLHKNEEGVCKSVRSLFSFLIRFFIFLVPIILILFLIQTVPSLIDGTYKFNEIPWKEFFSDLEILIIIPLLLSTFSDFHIKIFPKQVTVQHERIDADILFVNCFNEVIGSAAPRDCDKVVIFIDNIDRLNKEKILEALECLKTYLGNPKCVFVVACDDYVVRKEIDAYLQNSNDQIIAGEHYLDKFFQQTFRLPEYMSIDLHNFAREVFKRTKIYDELTTKCDVNNLVDIIIPINSSSPRKVKRLLNEFISYYEIAKKRENGTSKRIEMGEITNNAEFVAKFTTLRAEFPAFYNILKSDPKILEKIDNLIKDGKNNKEILSSVCEGGRFTSDNATSIFPETLLNYLRRTITIFSGNIDSFIWMSQDEFSIGLSHEVNQTIKSSLQNNNPHDFELLLDQATNELEKNKIIKTAANIVSNSSTLSQTNSLQVLSKLLPNINEQLRAEVANIAIRTLTKSQLSNFSVEELLNILRYSNSIGKKTILDSIIDRIFDEFISFKNFENIFEQIMRNSDILIELSKIKKFTNQFNDSIATMLDLTEKSPDSGLEEYSTLIKALTWCLVHEKEFREYSQSYRLFFCNSFFVYLKNLLLNIAPFPEISLFNSNSGENIQFIISESLETSIKGENGLFWENFIQLITDSYDIDEVKFLLDLLTRKVSEIPSGYYTDIYIACLEALNNFIEEEPEQEIEKIETHIGTAFNLLTSIRELNNGPINSPIDKGSNFILSFMKNSNLRQVALNEISRYSAKFPDSSKNPFMKGLTDFFIDNFEEGDINIELLQTIINLDSSMDDVLRKRIVETVDKNIQILEKTRAKNCSLVVENFMLKPTYFQLLQEKSKGWLTQLSATDITDDVFDILQNLFEQMVEKKVLSLSDLLNEYNEIFASHRLPNILHKAIESCEKYSKKIKLSEGGKIATTVIKNAETYNDELVDYFSFCSKWIKEFEDEISNKYKVLILSHIDFSNEKYVELVLTIFDLFSKEESFSLIQELYSVKSDTAIFIEKRKQFLEKYMSKNSDARCYEIIQHLEKAGNDGLQFVNDVSIEISENDLKELHKKIIDDIKSSKKLNEISYKMRILSRLIKEIDDSKPIVVSLFIYLLNGSKEYIDVALNNIVECIVPLNISNVHKGQLAESLANAAISQNSPELDSLITEKANHFLKWFNLDYYKNKVNKK